MHDHHDGCGCGHDHDDRAESGGVRFHAVGGDQSADPDASTLLAISVGNSRTALCVSREGERTRTQSIANDQFDRLAEAATKELTTLGGADALIASVNDPIADRLALALERAAPRRDAVLRLGRDVPIPVRHTLDAEGERTVGQDRLLNAIAGFEAVRQACVIVDAGTAITVDFVDGEGVFHGGAIAPGARAMLGAMHARTAALPDLALTRPSTLDSDAPPFGKNTPEAMLTGVVYAARGMVRALAERYAEFYEAYPQIIATGGDAPLLFEGDDLVEIVVPDLTLRGVASAYRQWAAEEAQ